MTELPVKKSPFYHCLEFDKHAKVLSDKATVERIKALNYDLEELVLTTNRIPYEQLQFLRERMSEKHYFKLCRLFTYVDPKHKDIIQLSLYTTEGEVNIPLMTLIEGGVKLYLLSEGGNISTLTRLTYKYIRLMFELHHCSRENVRYRIERKRLKSVNSDKVMQRPLLQCNGETHD